MSTSSTIKLNYTQAPGFFPIYRRLLMGRRAKYQQGAALPRFCSTWTGAQADSVRVESYCEACSLPFEGVYPVLYPHILTSPIHLDMMSKPEFPLSPMGAVHARNHIVQHAPIPVDAMLDITCKLTTTRVLKQGVEFEVTTTLERDGAPCWESISAYLVRGKKYGEPGDPSPLAELPDLGGDINSESWRVPRDMGWRYAKITGDFNPIHVSKLLAKLMGFDRDLIHGMWSAARCVGAVSPVLPEGPIQVDLLFKGPVYMETACAMKAHEQDSQALFELYCEDNPRPCIRGRAMPIEPGTRLAGNDS